ncbi:hypothetical protein CJ030_MR6G013332 [Morella rubra]|uniref:Succinate dehydogenase/fumarate reductase N-terminal domain-containing protein n=1 Tax=Morella rubra TaxID=262757 RepID=A0A6A1VC07_9ROSI|nr:hypothetical protein CJ030_MR6G013332 [Morella rubra]
MKRGREFPSVTSGQLHSAVIDHFDLDYTRHEDVRTVVETMMTARRTHRNRMHAYFKKFPSKEAALLKPHPDTTEEQWKELCDLFTSEAFMKRSEQNKKNRSKLTVNHAAGSRSFQRTRACMKNQESGNINPAELYKKNYTNKDGIWTSEGAREIYHQLAKARDEIEAMRAAREKDLQEFAKKQAEMEATLRDHREEQRVEQERIRLEQEERMKRSKSACEWSTRAHAKGRNIEGTGEENVLCNGEENERHVKATIQPVWEFKKVLDVLQKIKADDDSTLTYRRSCREGICGSCAMNIDGTNTVACLKPVDADTSKPTIIIPLPHMFMIRDLRNVLSNCNGKDRWNHGSKPQSRRRTGGNTGSHLRTERSMMGSMSAYSVLAVAAHAPSYWWNPEQFLGPATLLQAYRWICDSRDDFADERLQALTEDQKRLYRCRTTKNCTATFPKGLDPADAIHKMKTRHLLTVPVEEFEGKDRCGPSRRVQSCNYAKSSGYSNGKTRIHPVIPAETQASRSWGPYPAAILGFAGLAAFIHYNDERRSIPRGQGDKCSRNTDKGLIIGGPFTLIDTENRIVTEKDFHGKWVLLYFGYTSSPDVGPEQLQIIAKAMAMLDSKHDSKILPVFVTIDPQRDTSSQLRTYLKEFDSRIVGLTGPVSAVRQMAQEYRIHFKKVEEEGDDYLVETSHSMYLLNPRGKVVKCFGVEYSAKELVEAIVKQMKSTLI